MNTTSTVTIQFEPSGIRTVVPSGTDLLTAARHAGLSLAAPCGGNGTCGKCTVCIPEPVQACRTKADTDLIVRIPEENGNESIVILTEQAPDHTEEQHPSDTQTCTTAKVTRNRCGVAVDIGTTTLAAYLYDLDTEERLATASASNPQIPFGDDVISRIRACTSSENGLAVLRSVLLEGLSDLFCSLYQQAGITKDVVCETVLVGNTVMTHILLGISPEPLGHAPFTPVVRDCVNRKASDLSLPVSPEGRIYILPAADGFIGADHLAVLLHAEPFRYTGSTLIIDIGTNSEICLCKDKTLSVTSCATGPALEGAMIRSGMHASAGAIDHVSIDPDTLEPELHWLGETEMPLGICGSGIIDAVASMLECGILDADGQFSRYAVGQRIRTDASGQREYVLFEDETRSITVTQQDVRNIQLAKAALYAGIQLLLQKNSCTAPDRILLAGGFGSYMNIQKALTLGLFPDADPSSIHILGNAAGAGAIKALLHPASRRLAEEMAASVQFVESATDPAFSRLYGDAMMLPHRRDGFPISHPVLWSCPGNDIHQLPEEILERDLCYLEDPKELLQVLPSVSAFNQDPCMFLPLVQNLEACACGAPAKRHAGYLAPGAYPFKSLEELETQEYDLLSDPRIQAVLQCIEQMAEQPVVVEIEAPFTILSALIDPRVLYRTLRKEPERLEILLRKISDAECRYIEQLTKRGCHLLSLADPAGSSSFVGETLYQTWIAPSETALLKKSRRYLKNSLIHLCGHMAADLIRAGCAVRHPVRLDPQTGYCENLFRFSQDSRIRFMGPGCLRNHTSGSSRTGWILELNG